jgi:hypothetical protein
MPNMQMTKRFNAVSRWIIAPITGVVGFWLAPHVNSKHPPQDLSIFFSTIAMMLGTFFIALALLSIASRVANYRVRGIVGGVTFVYLLIGAIAAASGTVGTWPYSAYPYLFAISVGTSISTLITLTRIGIAYSQAQYEEDTAVQAQILGPSRP